MKVLIVYDSMFGNTARVAAAIGGALRGDHEVALVPVAEATPERLAEAELLFVGSPTQRFRPLPGVSELLKRLPGGSLATVSVAAFDTRIVIAEVHNWLLSFMARLFGPSAFAAPRIEAALRRAGGTPAAPFEGFIVDGTEGPLRAGELERAAQWARRTAAQDAVPTIVEPARQPASARTRVPG